MTKWLLLFGLLYCMNAEAQQQKHIDSLLMVKDYLLTLQQVVSDRETTLRKKVEQVDSLLKKGVYYETLFKTHLIPIVTPYQESERLLQSFRFIVQSAILFKTDVKQQGYKPGKSSAAEVLYLNKNIPPLVDSIYRYCSKALK